ncbi:holin [Streptomyces sp. DW26H14]|uniref:holin n=1 Tax=Streptomyces sp. DW26H14 TaxID=3435395 RepID=UPI00403DC28A
MNKPFLLDLAERTGATYVETFAGLLLADTTHLLTLGDAKAAAVAALPAAFTVIKAALAGSIGSSSTASVLSGPKTPTAPDPTPVPPAA